MINSSVCDIKMLTIASRKSKLALWQAEFVKAQLIELYPNIEINIIGVNTVADKLLDTPLAKIGGKGLFVKELEEQLLNHQADIAVHSMKDVPSVLPAGLEIAAILKRADARDALISTATNTANKIQFSSLKAGTKIGTSSLRRQAQILALKKDFEVISLRGNVDTRLKKLEEGQYDAIILAAAGLQRLGLKHRINEYFEINDMLPGIGQGALGIECRVDSQNIKSLIKPLHHHFSAQCVLAERSMNTLLGGSCTLPVAGFATITTKRSLKLQGMVATPDGQRILKASATGKILEAVQIGKQVAKALLAMGAEEIIADLLA